MDGVLYDSMPNHVRAWMKLMEHIKVCAREEEFYLHEGRTGAFVIDNMILREYGRHATECEKIDLYALKAKFFTELPQVDVMPGAQQLVSELLTHSVDTVLVTGSGQNSLLNRLDIDYPGAFPLERRVTSASVTHGKPHPEPYLKGLKFAGVNKEEAIAIDNAPLGVKSAHDAGIFTIGVVTGPIPRQKLENAGADIVFESMQQCADALPLLLQQLNNLIF